MTTEESESRILCALGVAHGGGEWLWRIEARRLAHGFSVVILDSDSGQRWRLASTAEPYSWQRFAGYLCNWRRLADDIAHRVDFSWIPVGGSRFIDVTGESGIVASALRFCLAEDDTPVTRWLVAQSNESIAALATALPNPLSEPRQRILEEMVEWVDELQMPADLLELSRHYGLAGPGIGLVDLRTRIAGDMAALVEIRRVRVERLQAQITVLAGEFSEQPRRAGGMGFASARESFSRYLVDYVGRHDRLPDEVVEVTGVGKVDFGELCRKCGV